MGLYRKRTALKLADEYVVYKVGWEVGLADSHPVPFIQLSTKGVVKTCKHKKQSMLVLLVGNFMLNCDLVLASQPCSILGPAFIVKSAFVEAPPPWNRN